MGIFLGHLLNYTSFTWNLQLLCIIYLLLEDNFAGDNCSDQSLEGIYAL